MHIKDGFLSPEVCLLTSAAAAGAVAYSLHRLKDSLSDRTVPLTGMMASLIFAGQMVNFPLPGVGVSGHLLGGVLASVVLGPWAGCIAIALVLFVQLALFSDGGWLVLGANVLNMAVIGGWGGWAVYRAVRRALGDGSTGIIVGSVVASWLSVMAAASLFCLEFGLSWPAGKYDLSRVFSLMVLFHSGIGIGEAIITGLVVSYVLAQRPDLIHTPEPRGGTLPELSRALWAGMVVALAVAAFLGPFASEYADGLDSVAERTQFIDLEQKPAIALLEDYEIPQLSDRWDKLAVSAAGIGGTLAVLVTALLLGLVLRPQRPAAEASHGS